MTDLTQLLDEIRRPEVSHVDMIKRRCRGSFQWFLERDCETHPIHDRNKLEFLICGEEAFRRIEADIRAAKKSIDLVLWGFDPGMELVRGRTTWPHGTTYGDLLVSKAREGVKVRMLLWYNNAAINEGAENVPDFPWFWLPVSPPKEHGPSPAGSQIRDDRTNSSWVLTDRSNYCTQWWKDALSGAFKNLEVRLRSGKALSIMQSVGKYLPESMRSLTEKAAVAFVGTHHQKPILIDYDVRPANPDQSTTCGYVMGLNSVTAYWDTKKHQFNNPQRELSANAYTWRDSQVRWHCKPYRDYAIRVEGGALYDLNRNFVEGWDSADGVQFILPMSMKLSGAVDSLLRRNAAHLWSESLAAQRKSIQPKDIPAPNGASCRAQVLRTQPEQSDATILKAYTLATSNAVDYIYVENQYFQLADWPKMLKKLRGRYLQGMRDGNAKTCDIAPLHMFVVIPQAERDEMVPNTYDTVAELGRGKDMKAYHGQVQGELKRRAEQPGVPGFGTASGSADVVPANPQADLEDLSIKVLVAMLMTYDHADQAKNIRIKARDNKAQEAKAKQEADANAKAQIHDGKPDDVDADLREEQNIVPSRYREIYIHSKLMFVDDVYTTLGSANLNVRSMAGDSELNICTEEAAFTKDARRRVWGNLAGADLDGGPVTKPADSVGTFKKWVARMQDNQKNRFNELPPIADSFIHPFEDSRDQPLLRLM